MPSKTCANAGTKARRIHHRSAVAAASRAPGAYLGFEANDAEYKVMGLAAYGQVDKKLLQKFAV